MDAGTAQHGQHRRGSRSAVHDVRADEGKSLNSAGDSPSVYDFPTFGAFLAAVLERRKEGRRPLSVRNFAKRLGVRSPSLLTMIAKGDRKASADLVHAVCGYLEMSQAEIEYAEAMAELDRTRSIAAKQRVIERLRQLRPTNSELMLALDGFHLISRWYNGAILELTALSRFREDPEAIAAFLGGGVTAAQVQESFELLLRLGLLVRDEDGRLRKASAKVRTPLKASQAIRFFHKQMLTRANQAIDKQSINERYVTGLTIPVPASKLSDAFAKIAAFRDTFAREMRAAERDGDEEVYQLNLHFFRATKDPAFRD